jgi:hypothetical protein
MGLLDDAIREHLELKRRHGADPGEVARQESEALGPVRRSAETVFEPEPDPEPEPEPEPEPVARNVESTIDQPTVEHPAAKPEPMIEDEADASPEIENEDGDVLEGTPEFLEETPEHDRLWFEQRPPRDFDFDD